MNFYSKVIFPRLLDWSMSGPEFAQYRHRLLAEVSGEVLEIGFGTGLNLAYYPASVRKITTVDPNRGMGAIAQRRIAASAIPVESHPLSGENLPFPNRHFDSVVSTWTLCSIPQVEQALREIDRVLKPGGQFFFIEHGLSSEPNVQRWQHRLTPIQKVIADGCHLDRNMRQLVEQQFATVTIEEFYAEDFPKVAGYLYQGIATKAGSV